MVDGAAAQVRPFLLEPLLKPKPWGGNALGNLFGRGIPDGARIGESWEVCARTGDSNTIASGPLAGRTLLEVIEIQPVQMLGDGAIRAFGPGLPLLVKFIDTSDWLSIQVHPDDCTARILGEREGGKEEAWVVVSAEPGVSLILGTSRRIEFEAVLEMCRRGRRRECLNFVEVQTGDVIHVPPGTLHAIGKDMLLLEVSQNSDVTYRIDDWDRPPAGRELQKELAGKAARCSPPGRLKCRPARTPGLTALYEGKYFRIFEAAPGNGALAVDRDTFASLTVIEGTLLVGCREETAAVNAGCTAFIPAASMPVALSGTGRGILVTPVV